MLARWKARLGTPPVYWWEPRGKPKHGFGRNFGDELNPWLFERIKGFTPRRAKPTSSGKTLAIGSVLHLAHPGDIVWGSGLNGKLRDDRGGIILPSAPAQVDFRAVRGPLTRDLLLQAGADVPPVYGDPALLLRQFVAPLADSERRGTLIIPHFTDYADTCAALPDDPDLRIMRVDAPVEAMVDAIHGSARVLTTALHGIIAAEALGVPVTFFRMRSVETLFKYEDYFAGTGRSLTAPPNGLQAALDGPTLPDWRVPEPLTRGLLETCPF